MGGLGDENALVAKARAAGPPPAEIIQRFGLCIEPSEEEKDGSGKSMSWREAAKAFQWTPRSTYPIIHEFERSVLPSIRTLRAQFFCGLCPHCNRPMIESVLQQHISECSLRHAQNGEKLKKELSDKMRIDAGSSNASTDTSLATRKKRKAGHDDAGAEDDSISAPKRSKSTAKQRTAKTTKAPKQAKTLRAKKEGKQLKPPKEKPAAVYVADKHCGVPLPNGQPCMRSLTCKQHSMGAKRAVPNRSAPYDVLLGNYHRQHQMKQAQLSASAAQAAQLESDHAQELQAQQNPEREVQQVWDGISRVYCAPLAVGKASSTPSRATNFRMREMLAVALLPRRLPPTGDVLYGRSLAYHQGSPEKLMYVRSQAVQQAVYLSQIQQQRQLQLKRQAEAAKSINMQAGFGSAMPAAAATSATQSTPAQRDQQPPRSNITQKYGQQPISARLTAQHYVEQRVRQASQGRNDRA